MMPIDLVLIRHGQSEGNVANRQSRAGNHSAFTNEFRNRHSGKFRLTEKGRQQAKIAGQHIRHDMQTFDRYIVSDYIRAMETAALLEMPDAEWYRDFNLRERDWGAKFDIMPESERQEQIGDIMALREIEPFYWSPPDGESIATVCLRISRVLHTLHRECTDKRVLIVCHGEVMWAFRIVLERLMPERFRELRLSKHPHNHIHNCQIMHYSRRDPDTGKLERYANWLRSICPWQTNLSPNQWHRIERQRFSNQQLLEIVEQSPAVIE